MGSDGGSETGRSTDASDDDRWLVLNPMSGSADHADRVHRLADERGYTVFETEYEGHATELAVESAEAGTKLLAVAGGDGTLHEVLRGLDDAGRLRDDTPDEQGDAASASIDASEGVTLGVIPAGTENLFASNVGIEGIEHGFEVIEAGRRRRLDLGAVNGEPFAVSCIAGLVAEASVSTSAELKEWFGSLAFVVSGVKEMAEFDPLDLDIRAVVDGEERRWTKEALCVFIGNVRRFAHEGGQANVEDGLFDVVIAERMPPSNLATEAIAHRLLDRDTEHVDYHRMRRIGLDSEEGSITLSVDGEPTQYDEQLTISIRPRALAVYVGPDYEPEPY